MLRALTGPSVAKLSGVLAFLVAVARGAPLTVSPHARQPREHPLPLVQSFPCKRHHLPSKNSKLAEGDLHACTGSRPGAHDTPLGYVVAKGSKRPPQAHVALAVVQELQMLSTVLSSSVTSNMGAAVPWPRLGRANNRPQKRSPSPAVLAQVTCRLPRPTTHITVSKTHSTVCSMRRVSQRTGWAASVTTASHQVPYKSHHHIARHSGLRSRLHVHLVRCKCTCAMTSTPGAIGAQGAPYTPTCTAQLTMTSRSLPPAHWRGSGRGVMVTREPPRCTRPQCLPQMSMKAQVSSMVHAVSPHTSTSCVAAPDGAQRRHVRRTCALKECTRPSMHDYYAELRQRHLECRQAPRHHCTNARVQGTWEGRWRTACPRPHQLLAWPSTCRSHLIRFIHLIQMH